jgi:HEPN domain-containing protein
MYPETVHAVRRYFTNAKSFLSAASEQYKGKAYAETLHLLNQSAVSSCKSVIRGCLGYETDNQELLKLISLTLNFTEEIFDVLPCDTKEERHLFSLLSKVPTADKNQDGNKFRPEDIGILIDRIQQMRQVSEKVIQQKIALLQMEEDL